MNPQAHDFGKRTDFYTFAPESLADALPAFEILREVGKGSMGIVYEARRREDGMRVALKVLPPSLTLTERALARFCREAELMQRVRHPSIVGVLDLGRQERLHYFVMEFVEGVNLAERLTIGPLPVRQVAHIGVEVARALQYAHDHGIVHRDVKPANLILRADGTIAITDFGLARETGTGSMTESGAIVGTPMFMAPEQVLGERDVIGSRSDVYGLGATLYALVTGQPPFSGPTAQSVLKQVLEKRPKSPRALRADVPAAFEAIVLKAMASEPELRYGTAEELADDLERFLAGERVLARRPGPLVHAWRSAGRRPGLVTLCGVIVALLAGAFALHRDGELQRLEAHLARAERTLAQVASGRDELGRKMSPEERRSTIQTAVAQASQVIALDSRYPRAWFVRARAHLLLQDYRAAVEDLDAAERAHGSTLPQLLLYRIEAASHLGDRGMLRRDLYRLLDLDRSEHSRCIVASHLLDMANGLPPDERGEVLHSVALIIEPIRDLHAHVETIRARLQELRGERDAALATIRRARERFPDDLRVQVTAAAIFRRLGLDAEGQDAAAMARAIDPTFLEVDVPAADAVDVDAMRSFLEDLESLVRAARRR